MPGSQDHGNGRRRVVIIGGGASGVFTACRLERLAEGRFDITILEKEKRIGGHAHSAMEPPDDPEVSIDLGAQFFSPEAQPEYCDMLAEEGILDDPALVTSHEVGMTVWHQTRNELLFKVPDSFGKILLAALADPVTWLCFAWFVICARILWARKDPDDPSRMDWSTTFGSWLGTLDFGFVDRQTADRFKRDVVRPLMYQFGLVAPDRLDDLSARFVVFYFLGLMPRFPRVGFTILNSTIGLDGLMDRIRRNRAPNTTVEYGVCVESVEHDGGGWIIRTRDDGPTRRADHLIISTNPQRARDMLPDDADHAQVRDVLGQMPYVDVLVRIQHPDPSYMPARKADWSVSNILVADTDRDRVPDHYMLTVWFGAVRGPGPGQKFFKSWGSPILHPDPENEPSHRQHRHQLMVGTPGFIRAREKLRNVHQGRRGLWFVGGYLVDYDTQNSALRSACLVAERLVQEARVPVSPELLFQFMRSDEVEARRRGIVIDSEPVFPDSFPLVESIIEEITTRLHAHPIVAAWNDFIARRPVAPHGDT